MSKTTRAALALAIVLVGLLPAGEAAIATEWRSRRINEAAPAGFGAFTADGEWVVFFGSKATPADSRLYAVRRWAGSAAAPITAPFPAGQGIDSFFRLTSDSRRALFRSWEQGSGYNRLWSVPVNGASGPVQLGPTTPAPGEFDWYAASPDGSRALFVGEFGGWNEYALLSAPVDGSAPAVQLNPAPLDPRGTIVFDVEFVGDGTSVLFVAEAEVYRRRELWTASIDGTSPAVRLNAELPPDDSCGVNGYESVPSTERVVYQVYCTSGGGEPAGVWSAPWDGSGTAVRLAPAAGIAGVDPTGGRAVVYRDLDGDAYPELWSVPLGGPESELVRLVESDVSGASLTLSAFSASGSHVVFQGELFDPVHEEVWTVPIDGSAPPVRLSPPVSPTAGFVRFEMRARPGSDDLLFAGDPEVFQRRDLYGAPADGSTPTVQLNVPATAEGVRDFQFVGEPARVVYNLFAAESQLLEIWSSAVDTPGTNIRLSPAPEGTGGAYQFFPSPRAGFVYFEADLLPVEETELWVVPAVGPSAAALRLSPDPVSGGRLISPLTVSSDGFGILYSGRFEDPVRIDLWLSDAMVFKSDFAEGDLFEWSSAAP